MEKYRLSLNENWLFRLTDDEAALMPDFDDSGFAAVTLPHDWQISSPRRADSPGGAAQGFFPREEVGVYRLHFTPDERWRGQTVHALFDGIQRFARVYLNGTPVGGRPYGYVPTLCDLTGALRFGEDNVLAVFVDNRDPSGGKWYAAAGDRWYSGAGIYRNAWLLVRHESHIAHDGVRVVATPLMKGPSGDVPDVNGIRCREAAVSLRAEIEGARDGDMLRVSVFGPNGETAATVEAAATAATSLAFTLNNPALWSPETPALYRAEVSLARGGEALDEHVVSFGVRSAQFDEEDGFLLNGVKTKLWGVNLHQDGGMTGAAVPIEVWKKRFKTLKELGVNTIRASHNPMAEEVYDLCDEMGFFVIDELYDKWDNSNMYFDALFEEWHERDLSAMIRRDANHPCVILWSVGNEVGGQYSERFFECLESLTSQARREDPTRGVTAALIGFVLPGWNDVTPLGVKLAAVRRYAESVDVFMGNYMEHFYEKLRESGMRKPIIGSEVRTYYRYDEKYMNSTQLSNESPYAIVKKYDWVCGAIVWAGVDYLGEASFWPMRGWTGNLLDATGDIKLRAWYCAAQWTTKPLLKLAVYDESEPWDGARGLWGFPQMRAHWKYTQFEKVMHVAAMTNCDTVKLYQNSQTVRVARLADFPDGMVHFYLPYIPGVLRAEGYQCGNLVAEDILYSDHGPDSLRVTIDRDALPADGKSVAIVDVFLEDKHGRRYMQESPNATFEARGAASLMAADNGDAFAVRAFDAPSCPLHNGHLMILLRAGKTPGPASLTVSVDGFPPREVRLTIQ